MNSKDGLPIIPFESQAAWEAWLDANHARSDGLWLKLARKDSGTRSLSYAEALEAALCYGWIDGQKAAFDDRFWLQRFSRRRPRSKWSKLNRTKAIELVAAGRMKAPGLNEIDAAKRDGRWDKAYASQRHMAVPDDLQKRLDETPQAGAFFASLDRRNRYAILYRIQNAKKPETRARRIETFVTMLEERRTLY